MSRNFELLTQIDREGEILSQLSPEGAPIRVPARTDGLPAQYEPLISFVQRVFLGIDMGAPRMVVFTGADRSSGCSWICAHTAKVLAALAPGLADALVQADPIRNFVQLASDGRFSVLCAGSAAELSQGAGVDLNRMRSRITELRHQFDYVLVDAPSLDLHIDGIVLAGASDGLIMVLGASSSRREAARSAVEKLKAANVPLLGAVLNKRTFPIPDLIYSKL